ncbi:MAG: PEP-CTERM sorting domain-containing protein [Candidatus Omnitrophica bacterium]|nr:PEP-CTERM sorting domain-containing protein [Candidatus Omnitrophota bacterium]
MNKWFVTVAVGALLSLGQAAWASTTSYQGSFTKDDDIQTFNINIPEQSNVLFRTFSYAGGVNGAGETVARGGFDPFLSLFDGTGAFIDSNDDAADNAGQYVVPADAVTGKQWDSYLSIVLEPGNYILALTQAENQFVGGVGDNISEGFTFSGQGNYTPELVGVTETTPFWEMYDNGQVVHRDGHWAVDVTAESQVVTPEPASMLLFGLGGAAMAFARRRMKV